MVYRNVERMYAGNENYDDHRRMIDLNDDLQHRLMYLPIDYISARRVQGFDQTEIYS